MVPLLLDSFQKLFGRFVGRVLRHEATLECLLQDPLSETGGSLQVGFDLGFNLVHDREAALHFRDDDCLLFKWWQENGCYLDLVKTQMGTTSP